MSIRVANVSSPTSSIDVGSTCETLPSLSVVPSHDANASLSRSNPPPCDVAGVQLDSDNEERPEGGLGEGNGGEIRIALGPWRCHADPDERFVEAGVVVFGFVAWRCHGPARREIVERWERLGCAIGLGWGGWLGDG